MHRTSLLSPPRPPPLPLLPLRRSFLRGHAVFRRQPSTPIDSSFRHPRSIPLPLSSPRAAAVGTEGVLGSREGVGERDVQESKFVEVGYLSSTHGIKGELRVMPSTDFPELRFCLPGTRWLSTCISGKELISEVQLRGGRGHPGQKSWIVSFSGIDTVDKAKQIVGSTLLVREGDRPDLEEGELYTRDLVGMRVVLKESGSLVGTVAAVFNYGAGDLLQVMLANEERQDRSSSSKVDSNSCGRYVWVPFVEAIVPEVDMDDRQMLITPPKGLLELNLRSNMRPKKERRQLEWKERKKLQQRLIPAKKKLAEMGQTHVLEGLRIREKVQKNLLARQIVNIDFKLFQQAIQSINKPFYSFSEFASDNSATFLKSPIRVSHDYLINCASEEKGDLNYLLHKEGLQLLSKSKAAIILIINEKDHDGRVSETNGGVFKSSISQFEDLLLGCNRFLKVEEQGMTVPLVVVSPAHLIQPYKECLSDHDYFGINSEKVWFSEEIQLPIVTMPIDQNGSKILLKSPWEILQAPIGSGGFLKSLLSNNIITELNEIGVEYVQVCSLNNKATMGHPLFLGLVSSHRADVGIKVFESSKGEDEFDMIFSMRHLNKISRQIDKLQFLAVPEQHVHVEQGENEFMTIYPDAPNSYSFRSSIYSSLNTCSLDTACIMKVFE